MEKLGFKTDLPIAIAAPELKFEPGVTLYVEGVKKLKFTGDYKDMKGLNQWAVRNAIPPFADFTDDIIDKLVNSGVKATVLLFAKRGENNAEVLAVEEAARTWPRTEKYDAIFILADPDVDYLTDYFGVTPEDVPCLRILEISSGEEMAPYQPDEMGVITSDSTKHFLELYYQGNLQPMNPNGGGGEEGGEGGEGMEEDFEEEFQEEL
jgi:hypothetical protein